MHCLVRGFVFDVWQHRNGGANRVFPDSCCGARAPCRLPVRHPYLDLMTAQAAPDANLHNLPEPGQHPPLAMLHGQPLQQLPRDLYIPPDALEVFLEAFEGPLDLLLYLIRRQNLDVMDIPVAEITRQYMQYIELMQQLRLELAADYLVMAAMLAQIKSQMLLPPPPVDDSFDGQDTFNDDPRAELARRLQEYERYRQAADALDALPRLERDTDLARADAALGPQVQPPPAVELGQMLAALQQVLQRSQLQASHRIVGEALSVRQRMSQVLNQVADGHEHAFVGLFEPAEGRGGVLVTLLAILELAKEQLLEIEQQQPCGPILVRARGALH